MCTWLALFFNVVFYIFFYSLINITVGTLCQQRWSRLAVQLGQHHKKLYCVISNGHNQARLIVHGVIEIISVNVNLSEKDPSHLVCPSCSFKSLSYREFQRHKTLHPYGVLLMPMGLCSSNMKNGTCHGLYVFHFMDRIFLCNCRVPNTREAWKQL